MNNNIPDNSRDGEDARRRAQIISQLAAAAAEAESKDVGADAEEAGAIGRILDNLGLRESTVDEELRDQSLADIVSAWSVTAGAALSVHRGESEGTMPVTPTDAINDLFESGVGQLTASIDVTVPYSGAVRIEATIGVPSKPIQAVIAEIAISGRSTPLRFPLQLVNRGSEDFALLELSGGASLLEGDLNDTVRITEVRLQNSANTTTEE